MVKQNGDSTIRLIQAILETHQQIGVDETIEALKTAREKSDCSKTADTISFLFAQINKQFHITRAEILTKNTSLEKTPSLICLCVLLKKHVCFSVAKIASLIEKTTPRVYQCFKIFNELDGKLKGDKDLLDKINLVETSLIEYINKKNHTIKE